MPRPTGPTSSSASRFQRSSPTTTNTSCWVCALRTSRPPTGITCPTCARPARTRCTCGGHRGARRPRSGRGLKRWRPATGSASRRSGRPSPPGSTRAVAGRWWVPSRTPISTRQAPCCSTSTTPRPASTIWCRLTWTARACRRRSARVRRRRRRPRCRPRPRKARPPPPRAACRPRRLSRRPHRRRGLLARRPRARRRGLLAPLPRRRGPRRGLSARPRLHRGLSARRRARRRLRRPHGR